MNLSNLSLEDLSRRCADDTTRFHREQVRDTQHCFELLRRALAEGRNDAFTRVYQIYEPQVLRWVYQHTRFQETGESAEYFANQALTSFYFALRGEKFAKFDTLPQVLTYLKMCVHSAIAQFLRKERVLQLADLDPQIASVNGAGIADNLQAAELWDHICDLLPDDGDRLLARCVFVQALKPAQIARGHPDRWRTPREVSVALQRIRRHLRKDPVLRDYAGIPAADPS
ncbi:MAG: sigma-70 family RNA polymerase sigma factor [Chloroflexi bacterium]|nr:sigma-70 family RNA polymerase sigma factor [Chloroflexota bacterium]